MAKSVFLWEKKVFKRSRRTANATSPMTEQDKLEQKRKAFKNLSLDSETLFDMVQDLQQKVRELERDRNEYGDLFDLAPVSYMTLDEAGAIVDANYAAARLLAHERYELEYVFLILCPWKS